jgi:hypothetical protein
MPAMELRLLPPLQEEQQMALDLISVLVLEQLLVFSRIQSVTLGHLLSSTDPHLLSTATRLLHQRHRCDQVEHLSPVGPCDTVHGLGSTRPT